jgi:hypothetical protein
MPLEIRELIVKVNLEEQVKKPGLSAKELQDLKNRIIQECMEKIMKKLDNATER